ncbi:UNVERIFIED_CONTAM: hypothetical protein HDU68_007437 [Siphonaria sp. JEL0065]|nr:hypothetical protein HDU68_007437 [Siphonaria sp. JEL0065]
MGGEDKLEHLTPSASNDFLVASGSSANDAILSTDPKPASPTRLPTLPVHASHGTHTGSESITVQSSFWALWTGNLYFNIASVIFAPLGILSYALHWSDTTTFILNFCAIIPLAKMLDYSTDQLSMRVGQTMGGLLNATFGNAVELIVGILALKAGQLRIVQASIIGSMISNLLLVLGLCFFCGGFWATSNGWKPAITTDLYQKFDTDKANVNTGLLSVVVLGFIIPAAFQISGKLDPTEDSVIQMSRGTAVVLLITYIAYLVFQMKTNPNGLIITPSERKAGLTSQEKLNQEQLEEEEEEEEVPDTLGWVAAFGLVAATIVIGVCAEFLVDSLDGLSEQAGISHTFIGIIILPIVGNAAEHVTAVSSAMRNKMDLCIAVAVGSSMQIALLVAPILVLIGWMIGQPLTLDFELFETAVLCVSIFVVSTLISDGRTHWLEGTTTTTATNYNNFNDSDSRPASTASTGSASPIIRNSKKQKSKKPFALTADTIDDLRYYLSQIYMILKPVLACIFFAILWVKLLAPPQQYWSGAHVLMPPDIYALNFGGGNVNSSVSGTVANPNNESAEQQHQDLLMALKTLGSVVGATLVIFLLFYYNCMKILYGIFGFIILGVLGLFGYYISYSLLWLYNVPFDTISFYFLLWNFAAVGILAVFWKGPLWLQQVYLVLMSSMMAYMLTNPSIPPITSWILLALLAVWDLIAVLCPYGPLRLLIETSKSQNREIPALLYSAGPTTMMAAPETNRKRMDTVEDEETEMDVLPSKKKGQSSPTNFSSPPSPIEEGHRNRINSNGVEVEEEEEEEDGGMKLGLGDFVFYSVLASRAALSDWVPTTAVTIGLLTGLNFTIFLLVIWQKALPALPFSIAFGLLFYFTAGLVLVPFVNNLSTLPMFPVYSQEAESWLVVGQFGGSGMVYV